MMKKILFSFLFLALVFTPHVVMAKSYTVFDSEFGFVFNFPDSWKSQGSLADGEKIHLVSSKGEAECKLSAVEDRRFLVYPRRFDKEILSQEFDWSYWEDVTADYQDRFFHFDNVGSIGRGDARYTVVDYSSNDGQSKREVIYASLYGDMYFVARCYTDQNLYDEYVDHFMSMIGSIDFKPAYSAYNNGYYRNFMGDGYVKPNPPSVLSKTLPEKKINRIHTAY